MRMRSALFDIAAVVAGTMSFSACSSSSPRYDPASDDGPREATVTGDTGGQDVTANSDATQDEHAATDSSESSDTALDSPKGTGSWCDASACGYQTSLDPPAACAILAGDTLFDSTLWNNLFFGATCETFCQQRNQTCPCAPTGNTDLSFWRCSVPQDYVGAFQAARADSSVPADGTVDAGDACPAWSAPVLIQCEAPPVGRRTASAAAPGTGRPANVGEEFAARTYLEAVSVHAFAVLERELQAHGAPHSLRRGARRARRDEIRHTAMSARLSRRFGGRPRTFEAPAAAPVRSLRDIAIENAVEGCVRETYGAVVGLVEARVSRDAQVRRAMQRIAVDECRHAELAWAVAAWLRSRLTEEDRVAVDRAMDAAIAELARGGVPSIVQRLRRRVWEPARA
jgi:hypothetical protein